MHKSQIASSRRGRNTSIYVGNLSLKVTEDELRQEFAVFGEVHSVTLMNDEYIGSGRAKGYAYIEMSSQSEAKAAIAAINGKQIRNKTINVIEALPLSNENANTHHEKKANKNRSRERETKYYPD